MKSRLAGFTNLAYNRVTEIYRLVSLRPERFGIGLIKQEKKGTQTYV